MSEALCGQNICRWKREGNWPPPKGAIILPLARPPVDEVVSGLEELARISTPKEKIIVDGLIEKKLQTES